MHKQWKPPPWLRKLGVTAREPMPARWVAMSGEDRLWLAFELMSFGIDCVREQAARRGCTVRELRHVYDQAASRLRARV